MASFKQTQIKPGVTKARSSAVKVYVDENIAIHDILSVTGVQGDFMKVAKADANGAVTLNNSLLYVADYAAADGSYTPVALPWKVVVGVNTSGSFIGAPAFLSDTAGGFSLTKGSIKVGTVLTVATAPNDGTILFAPQGMNSTTGTVKSLVTTMINVGANDVEIQLTQPAGTVLTDFGCVLTTAIVGTSGNINVKLGTADDGAELVAATAIMSEGDTSAAWVADSPLYTAAARTLYFRSENSHAITQGAIAVWSNYEYVG